MIDSQALGRPVPAGDHQALEPLTTLAGPAAGPGLAGTAAAAPERATPGVAAGAGRVLPADSRLPATPGTARPGIFGDSGRRLARMGRPRFGAPSDLGPAEDGQDDPPTEQGGHGLAVRPHRPGGAQRGRAEHESRWLGAHSNLTTAALLLSPVLVVVLVVVGYVALRTHTPPTAAPPSPARTAPPSLPKASNSPAAALGPWKHITNRTDDPTPLSTHELFPANFTETGTAADQTISDTSTNCVSALIGSSLRGAVRKAGCTQVLRASYLSTDGKVMATIGVLNLVDVNAAERVGKASGSSEFIKQLAAAHGPTRKLGRGTGLEAADVMGHYLVLTWAEFTNLHQPSRKEIAELRTFSTNMITGTVNVSLTSRMVTGHPAVP